MNKEMYDYFEMAIAAVMYFICQNGSSTPE